METDLLDVRPGAPQTQIKGAAHIPIEALPEAQSELPDKDQLIRIANTGPEAAEALEILESQGRKAQLENNFHYTQNQESHRLWRPNDFLAQILPQLKPGTALDLACGAGREAAYLAHQKHQVTAIDHLPDAIDRAKSLAHRYNQDQIKWIQADLRTWWPDHRPDLTTMFFYLNKPLIQHMAWRSQDLIFESFSPAHRELYGKPNEDMTITPEQLQELIFPLTIKHLDQDLRPSGRHTTRLWAQRQTKID